MRVFVIGTGRCGSVSFFHACKHITNYTVGNETYNLNLEYPDNHIEVNPQLRLCLSKLIRKYPDSLFVHLIRNENDCVKSLAALNHGQVMEAYTILYPSITSPSLIETAKVFYECENELICTQLREATYKYTYLLELTEYLFPEFFIRIKARGDLFAALDEWKTPKNTREERGENEEH